LPLYIGKSVNLRSRLLAHLRTPDEARMLRQTQRISHVRTAGELGALLLEAQWIKEQQPLFNQKLRRNRQLCSWLWQGDAPALVHAREVDFALTTDLFGLYASRHAAQEALRALADEHRLCWGALGLERLAPGRGCFRASVRQCAGVCRGDESLDSHQERLKQALAAWRVSTWPYAGAVGLVESDGDLTQVHVVRHWCFLGSAPDVCSARGLTRVASAFDADAYQILAKPLLTGTVQVVAL
jgi:excinuclease Cho